MSGSRIRVLALGLFVSAAVLWSATRAVRGTEAGPAAPRVPASGSGHAGRTQDEPDPAGAASAKRESPSPPPRPDTRPYRVRAVLRDHDGSVARTPGARWSFRLEPGAEEGGEARLLDLDGGELEFDAPPGSRLVVLQAGLDGRQARPRVASALLGDEELVTFVADLPGDGLVRVVDAHSGLELERVHVVPASPDQPATSVPPAAALAGSGRALSPSPIALPANERSVAYWLGAPGHAWCRIQFGASSGRPEYALWPGGDVRVETRGAWDPAERLVLTIERRIEESGRPEHIAEEPLSPGKRLELRGLPLGPMQALVVWRDARRPDLALAAHPLVVAAGPPTTLEIDLDALPGPRELGEVELTVQAHDELEVTALEASIEAVRPDMPANAVTVPLRDMERGDDGHYRFRFRERQPGVHRVSLEPGAASADVTVRPASPAEVFLKAPEIAKLRLWVLDAATADPIESLHVLWRPAESGSPLPWKQARSRSAGGALELALAAGRVEIAAQATGFATATRTLELAPGWNEDSIELRPVDRREIHVHVRSGGHDVPVPETTWSGAAAVDGSANSRLVGVRPTGTALGDGSVADTARAVLLVDGPGTYEVAIGRVPGFGDPGSKRVVVGDSAATVTFDLVREVGGTGER